MSVAVGISAPMSGDAVEFSAGVRLRADAGLDHLMIGDHVSFFVGFGMDGLLRAGAAHAIAPQMGVHLGVYLLPLRHPVLVARQLADLQTLAPGKLVLGVGVGGEDRHEVEVCGVDPASRGRRMDECIDVIRAVQGGLPVDFKGEFFDLDAVQIVPAVNPATPILVGGRSNRAIERVGRRGDGWLGIWCSAQRFAAATEKAAEIAVQQGRPDVNWRHEMQLWCAIDNDRAAARRAVSSAMKEFYQMDFEPFEKYTPYGSPEEIAEFLRPYVEAGCSSFNLITAGPDDGAQVEGVARVRELLRG